MWSLAYAGLRGIIAMVPPNTIPDEAQIALNGPVLLFTLGDLGGGGAAVRPGSGTSSVRPRSADAAERGGPRAPRAARGSAFCASALVVGEVALSLMLLVGASLMIRTLISIQGADLAFHPDRILTLRIPFSEQRYPDADRRNAFLQEVLRTDADVPGRARGGDQLGLPPVYTWSFPVSRGGQFAAGEAGRS